jgi:hypothetical protein
MQNLFERIQAYRQLDRMADLPVPSMALPTPSVQAERHKLYILDYGAGNVRRYDMAVLLQGGASCTN